MWSKFLSKRFFSTAIPPPTASNSLFQPGNLLFKHKHQLNKVNLLSTKMAPPSTVKQIPLTDWPDTGLLKLIGEEKASIELYQSFPRREPSDANTPSNSWLQVCIPFGRNKNLRENFCRFWSNSIRIGRLLEILDYIGGSISYSYCYQQPYGRSMTLVTACVDHFNFFESITLEKDIYLTVTLNILSHLTINCATLYTK